MSHNRYLAAALAVMMVLSVVALPGMVAANESSDGGLEIAVSQPDDVIVAVTDGGDPVENATVTVEDLDANDSEPEPITDTTDENGEIALTAPNETMTVEFAVAHGGETAATTATIQGTDSDDEERSAIDVSVAQGDGVVVTVTEADGDNDTPLENATVVVETVEDNVTYAGAGNYTTDESGTVSLPAPEERTDVRITATAGDRSAEAVETLESVYDGQPNFGGVVSLFVSNNVGETDGPFGLVLASFVVENNPGNAPAHAGPPSDAGSQGPPAHAGQSDDDGDDERGPPAHAGPPSDEDHEDDKRGPPAHAGQSGDDGESDETDDEGGEDGDS